MMKQESSQIIEIIDKKLLETNPQPTIFDCQKLYEKISATDKIIKRLQIHTQQADSQISADTQKLMILKNSLNRQKEGKDISIAEALEILAQQRQIKQMQYELTEMIKMSQELAQTQKSMKQKQAEYKELMKKKYKFVRPNKAQQSFNKYLKDKLLKNMQNLENEMRQVYQIGGRSSISSSSVGNYAIEDWIIREKQQKIIKEKQKLLQQILFFEEQLKKL